MDHWKSYKYKNLTYLVISLLIGFFLSIFDPIHQFILHLGSGGYILAFFLGMLFISTFTVSIGTVLLFWVAKALPLWEVGFVALLGALIADITIFRFTKDHLTQEVERLYKRHGGKHISHILHSQYFSWTLPVIGAILLISPLNQKGMSVLGISKMKHKQFLVSSFLVNAFGIILTLLLTLAI